MTTQLHTSLSLFKNLTSLKLRSITTTALKRFDIPSLLSLPTPNITNPAIISSSRLRFEFLKKVKIEVMLKTASYPGGSSGSRWGDEIQAMEEAQSVMGEVGKVVGVEGVERWIRAGWDCIEILELGWEVEREVLGLKGKGEGEE
jgi:hypothetical protein